MATEDQLDEVLLLGINIHHKLWPMEGHCSDNEGGREMGRERERERENENLGAAKLYDDPLPYSYLPQANLWLRWNASTPKPTSSLGQLMVHKTSREDYYVDAVLQLMLCFSH